MTPEEKQKLIADAVVTLELTVGEFSDLLYTLNLPFQVPTITYGRLIEKINKQLEPQVKRLESSF